MRQERVGQERVGLLACSLQPAGQTLISLRTRRGGKKTWVWLARSRLASYTGPQLVGTSKKKENSSVHAGSR